MSARVAAGVVIGAVHACGTARIVAAPDHRVDGLAPIGYLGRHSAASIRSRPPAFVLITDGERPGAASHASGSVS
jgi:hypothetical protein